MTDKQIIIDGVDVSKCKYYKELSNPNEDGDEYNDICECCITESAFCFDECNSNCYFKNWQRKEQECYEYIKELARFQQEVVPKLRKRLRDKEQECEELKERLYVQAKEKVKYIFELDQLKEQLEAYKMEAEEGKEFNAELKSTNEDLLSIQYKLADNNKRLRQTLTDIKEIVFPKNQLIITDSPIILKIQEKISEVEDV